MTPQKKPTLYLLKLQVGAKAYIASNVILNEGKKPFTTGYSTLPDKYNEKTFDSGLIFLVNSIKT